jgi:hypothetical protein
MVMFEEATRRYSITLINPGCRRHKKGGNTMNKRIQQGDCILEYVDSLPEKAKKIKFDGIVLKGEGVNTHAIDPKSVMAYELNGELYLSLTRKTEIIHEEHGTTVLSPGIVRRYIEREWDYEQMEAQNTRD